MLEKYQKHGTAPAPVLAPPQTKAVEVTEDGMFTVAMPPQLFAELCMLAESNGVSHLIQLQNLVTAAKSKSERVDFRKYLPK